MTRNEAIDAYLKSSPISAQTINRIMMWDEKKTLKSNADFLMVSIPYASDFRRKFGLKCVMLKPGRKKVINNS